MFLFVRSLLPLALVSCLFVPRAAAAEPPAAEKPAYAPGPMLDRLSRRAR